jgi:hypothetical protein
MTTTAPQARIVSSPGVKIRRLQDQLATIVLWTMAVSVIVMLAIFVAYLFFLGARYLTPDFIFGLPKETEAASALRSSTRSTS